MKYIKITSAFCFSLVCFCCTFDEPALPQTCRSVHYNPEIEFCFNDYIVYEKCDGLEYDPRDQKCENNILIKICWGLDYDETTEFCYNDEVYSKCGGQKYNPGRQKCENDIILEPCGQNKYYNKSTEFCYIEEVYAKCDGQEYKPTTHFCSNNALYKKCNGSAYHVEQQECSEDGSTLFNHCEGVLYDPYSKYCVSGNVVDKEIFTDSRDGKKYKTVAIGMQTWMAENLNYDDRYGKCYDNNPANCEIYGRLYDWRTAMEVCPAGWHLPSSEEWQELVNTVGDDAGTKLKATVSWNSGGNGTDEFGFTALAGGYGRLTAASVYNFVAKERYANLWNSTDLGLEAYNSRSVVMYDDLGYVSTDRVTSIYYYLAVRCIKDEQ